MGGKEKSYLYSKSMDAEERVRTAARTGEVPPKEVVVDLGAYDESRGTAQFLVLKAEMTGGSEREMYPDGWHVTARRVLPDGSRDPSGEQIFFIMTGYFSDMIPPDEVEIVARCEAL